MDAQRNGKKNFNGVRHQNKIENHLVVFLKKKSKGDIMSN